MKIIGIIAEYNPFHNGHAYQLDTIRKTAKADYIIIAMSGDFVQRGTPAILDKYARTKMALSCGADLVLELPTLWAASSAEAFAMAGVTLFDKLGCADGICFGAETDNLTLLTQIADLLIKEPPLYRNTLASHLKKGASFPAARANALYEYLTDTALSLSSDSLHESFKEHSFACNTNRLSDILNEPNNILAIEYLKAIQKRGSSLVPHIIKREGAGYHDTRLLPSHTNMTPIASATAIRSILQKEAAFAPANNGSAVLSAAMPAAALSILHDYLAAKPALYEDDFSQVLGYLLHSSSQTVLADIADSNEEIANRLRKNRFACSSFREFCQANKSRDITYTRMSRILLHLILNITTELYTTGKGLDYIPYLRILGFRRNSSAILRQIKNNSSVPLISKLTAAAHILNSDALQILEKDIFAADLYESIAAQKNKMTASRSEYTREIVIL